MFKIKKYKRIIKIIIPQIVINKSILIKQNIINRKIDKSIIINRIISSFVVLFKFIILELVEFD